MRESVTVGRPRAQQGLIWYERRKAAFDVRRTVLPLVRELRREARETDLPQLDISVRLRRALADGTSGCDLRVAVPGDAAFRRLAALVRRKDHPPKLLASKLTQLAFPSLSLGELGEDIGPHLDAGQDDPFEK
jgi:hypothetical protein